MNISEVEEITKWIKEFVENAHADGVVVGMSGGKDSLTVAGLCAKALGKENVLGVIMPNGEMSDYSDAVHACEHIGIKYVVNPITDSYNTLLKGVKENLKIVGKDLSDVTTINTAPRLRTTTLYAIAGSLNYLVANTSNLSEGMVGYTTKWGDNIGDFSAIANYTKSEVCEIGMLLGLPEKLVHKTPSDGLSGKSDEDKLGVTYESIDNLIRNNTKDESYERIMHLNKVSEHKRKGVICYKNNRKNFLA